MERVWVIQYVFNEQDAGGYEQVVMVCASLTGEAQEKFGIFTQLDANTWATENKGENKYQICRYEAEEWKVE